MVGLPLFLLSSRLSRPLEIFVVRYREIIVLNLTMLLFPIKVYRINKDLRKHVKERMLEMYH